MDALRNDTVPIRYGLLGLFAAALAVSVCFTGVEGQLFFLSQLLLWLCLSLQLLATTGRIVVTLSPFLIVLCLFTAVQISSAFWSSVPGYSQTMAWRQGALLIACFALTAYQRNGTWLWIKRFIFFLALLLVLYSIGQHFSGEQARATFLNRNSFAAFLLPIVFWTFCPMASKLETWLNIFFLSGCGFVFGLVGSRGALLAVGFGFACFCLLSWRGKVSVKFSARPFLAVITGLLCSLLVTGMNGGAARLATIVDPQTAGADRYLIWQASWRMLREAPWYGIGSGIYGLVYPAYRNVEDLSAGHFAHNDLLQIFIENGWPGFVLAVALCLFFVRLVGRGMKQAGMDPAQKQELALLASGIAAVSFHSLFTFNFYVYSILLVCGVVLARIHTLLPVQLSGLCEWDLSRYGRIMPYLPALFCLFPLSLLFSGWWSQAATDRALDALRQNNYEDVAIEITRAKQFWPSNDFNWYMEGELLRLALRNQEQLSESERRDLYHQSLQAFIRARELNPYRALTPHKMGLLFAESNGAEEKSQAASFIKDAVNIDPRYIEARFDLTQLYLARGELGRAEALIDKGLKYSYRDRLNLGPFLGLARNVKHQSGQHERANLLQERIEIIIKQSQEKR